MDKITFIKLLTQATDPVLLPEIKDGKQRVRLVVENDIKIMYDDKIIMYANDPSKYEEIICNILSYGIYNLTLNK